MELKATVAVFCLITAVYGVQTYDSSEIDTEGVFINQTQCLISDATIRSLARKLSKHVGSSLLPISDNMTNLDAKLDAGITNLGDKIDSLATKLNNSVTNLNDKLLAFLETKLGEIIDKIQEVGAGIANLTAQDKIYKDCAELIANGATRSGVYTIKPATTRIPFEVYCDMKSGGGGWTLFQKRMDGSVNFTRVWDAYKGWFGDIHGEFWFGNDKLHRLTFQDDYELRIDMEDWNSTWRYAVYSRFHVGSEADNYQLTVGDYSGNAGDSLIYHNGSFFSTFDKDNDESPANCANAYKAGWWFVSCFQSNLNGNYNNTAYGKGINWNSWKGPSHSLKKTEMKLRPIGFQLK